MKRTRIEEKDVGEKKTRETKEEVSSWRCVPGIFAGTCTSVSLSQRRKEGEGKYGKYTYYPSEDECKRSCPSMSVDPLTSLASYLGPKEITSLRATGSSGVEALAVAKRDNFDRQLILSEMKRLESEDVDDNVASQSVKKICAFLREGRAKMFDEDIGNSIALINDEYMVPLVECMLKNKRRINTGDIFDIVSDLLIDGYENEIVDLIEMGLLKNANPFDVAIIMLRELRLLRSSENLEFFDELAKRIDKSVLDPIDIYYLWFTDQKLGKNKRNYNKHIYITLENLLPYWKILIKNGINLPNKESIMKSGKTSKLIDSVEKSYDVLEAYEIDPEEIMNVLESGEFSDDPSKEAILKEAYNLLRSQPYFKYDIQYQSSPK